jgi:hypothetical protein
MAKADNVSKSSHSNVATEKRKWSHTGAGCLCDERLYYPLQSANKNFIPKREGE